MINLTTEERNNYKKILKNYNMMNTLVRMLDIEIDSINMSECKNDKNTIKHLELLNTNKKYYKDIVYKINIALERLNNIEKQLVQLRYLSIDSFTWYQIGSTLHLSEGYCRTKLNDKCLYKLFKIKDLEHPPQK